jgi:hypothetical protein
MRFNRELPILVKNIFHLRFTGWDKLIGINHSTGERTALFINEEMDNA